MRKKQNIYKQKKQNIQKETGPGSKNQSAAGYSGSHPRPDKAGKNLFAAFLLKCAGSSVGSEAEPLAHLDYSEEIALKNKSIRNYFSGFLANDEMKRLNGIVPSPRPRGYRTTTKRRVVVSGLNTALLSGEGRGMAADGVLFNSSLLEPEEHTRIYELIHKRLSSENYRLLSQSLNYVIIRGSYTEFSVIFNVHKLSAEIVRKLKNFIPLLERPELNVVSAFIYYDPTHSDYYFESRRPGEGIAFKKLFGKDRLSVSFGRNKYFYSPTAFSQINISIVPAMLSAVEEYLGNRGAKRLVDLYCGYGLFSFHMAGAFREIVGIDAGGTSITSALESAGYFREKFPSTRFRFITKKISGRELAEMLPGSEAMPEVFILDPPRQGTDEGVIESVAARAPEYIVHIFCGIERIPVELKQWKNSGYEVDRILPLDMFPGTPGIETIVFLKRR
ncbi:MAG: class I SAM-dependent RNA methyltransferase [Bacteroidota bacterium]